MRKINRKINQKSSKTTGVSRAMFSVGPARSSVGMVFGVEKYQSASVIMRKKSQKDHMYDVTFQ